MVFSSTIFLFLFLPIVLLIHFLLRGVAPRNLFLLIASLVFYAWGEQLFALIMIASIAINYGFGLGIERLRGQQSAKLLLIASIVLNLGLLILFKYSNFLVSNLNSLLGGAYLQPVSWATHLPAGISFFTFHAISYVIDIYRQDCKPQKNPIKVALYFDFFPQLIAGPIVRYHEIEQQLSQRTITIEGFALGVRRFVLGLGKKVLIANTLAGPVDKIFAIPTEQLTPGLAWFGIGCYTLQIYFDFSGYSDMAIGLGYLFGFKLPENFNYPYISRSIREFWRRWHISLSNWLRDYLYIPLGGNRCSPVRNYFNLLTVFLLCGFWHGASWNFVIWGLFHGFFLVLERQSAMKFLETLWLPVQWLYALLVIIVGWVFFRADTLPHAIAFLQAMVGIYRGDGVEYHTALYWNSEIALVLCLGAIAATPFLPLLVQGYQRLVSCLKGPTITIADLIAYSSGLVSLGAIFTFSVMKIAAGTYNPFIYFRF